MIQTIKNNIKVLIVATLLLIPVLALPAVVSAQPSEIQQSLCSGASLSANAAANTCDVALEGSEDRITGLISDIINIFSLIVGVISVIMIIIGGLKYITSAGDSNNVTSAKNTILYAIIGLVVVALAQFIVKFVLSKAVDA